MNLIISRTIQYYILLNYIFILLVAFDWNTLLQSYIYLHCYSIEVRMRNFTPSAGWITRCIVLLLWGRYVLGVSLDREPTAILNRAKLVGLFPLDNEEFENLAFPNNKTGAVPVNGGSERSAVARRGSARYFDGKSFVQLSLHMDSKTYPSLTIGGWVRPTAREDVTSQLR